MDIGIFFGRFHPVAVHLPIGFLLLAILLEIYARKIRAGNLDKAISIALFLGFISGIISVLFGFLISSEGGYQGAVLSWHKILGIVVTASSFLCWLIKTDKIRLSDRVYLALAGILTISLVITGHLGGMLTHGNDFLLAGAPDFIQKVFNTDKKHTSKLLPPAPDSVVIYSHVIKPIFEKNCTGCHSRTKSKAGLTLDTYQDMMTGSENGSVVKPGLSMESEIFRRVTLPPTDPGYMPPNGMPLSYGEIRLLKWWIDKGASDSLRLSELSLTDELLQVFRVEYAYDASPKSFLEIRQVPEPEEHHLRQLRENHFSVSFLSKGSNFIDVRFELDSIRRKELELLSHVSEQIAWLDLSNSGITDEMLDLIGGLPNMTRLRLDGNPVTDKGIILLEGLSHLETINLYGTEVGKEGLESLIKLPGLKKAYLAQSSVNRQEIQKIQKTRPDLEIIPDLRFTGSLQ